MLLSEVHPSLISGTYRHVQRANGVRAAGRPLPRQRLAWLRPQGPKPRQVKGPDQQALLIPEPPEGQPEQLELKPEPMVPILGRLMPELARPLGPLPELLPVQKPFEQMQQAY